VKHAAVCRRQARETYFSERLHLLKCLQIVFNEAVNNGPYRSHFDDHLTSKLIRDKNLPRNLLEGLLRNLEWEKEFKSDDQVSYDAYREELTPAQAREKLLSQLQSEQIAQLKLLFGLYFKFHSPSVLEVSLMLQYLKASNYNGSLIREFKTLSESQTFLENQQLISGLGILTSLCMLQLHKSPAKAIIMP
jgi:hypothetical protein